MTTDPFPKPISGDQKPHIDYPCSWTYKVIGCDEAALRSAIATVIGDKNPIITPSHTSSSGKYCSLNVDVSVPDAETRLRYYQLLTNHVAVKVVM